MTTKILATVNFKEVQDCPAIAREYHDFRAGADFNMESCREVRMANNGGRLTENTIIKREDVEVSELDQNRNPGRPTSVQLQIKMLEEDGFHRTQHGSLNDDLHFVRDREFYYNDETKAVLDTLYEASVAELKRELSDANSKAYNLAQAIEIMKGQMNKREQELSNMMFWQRIRFAFKGVTP